MTENLTSPVDAAHLTERFYGGAQYKAAGRSLVKQNTETVRALWRDRLFDRQTELLQKHVEFSQRQQTELCETMKGVWQAKEEQSRIGTLDREMLLKILDNKTVEMQEMTKQLLATLTDGQSTSHPLMPVTAAILPLQEEVRELQQQIVSLKQKQIHQELLPPQASNSLATTLAEPQNYFYSQIRSEIEQISEEIAKLHWPHTELHRAKRGAAPTEPQPAKFILRPMPGQEIKDRQVLTRAKPIEGPKKKIVNNRLAAPSPKLQLKTTTQLSLPPSGTAAKPRIKFDMQTSTSVQALQQEDFTAIDDLVIDLPFSYLAAPPETKSKYSTEELAKTFQAIVASSLKGDSEEPSLVESMIGPEISAGPADNPIHEVTVLDSSFDHQVEESFIFMPIQVIDGMVPSMSAANSPVFSTYSDYRSAGEISSGQLSWM